MHLWNTNFGSNLNPFLKRLFLGHWLHKFHLKMTGEKSAERAGLGPDIIADILSKLSVSTSKSWKNKRFGWHGHPTRTSMKKVEVLLPSPPEDGYAYLDGALPREDVLAARSYLLNLFSDRGDILEAGRPPTDGVLQENCGVNCVPFMEGKNDWTHNSTVLKVLESDNLKRLFAGLFGEEPLTFDFKWLRAVPNGSFTGAHYDAVYMSRGASSIDLQ